ncbi:hypothetical protein BX616_002152 [Lobosporangium transversale]|nr:hypothetical protein BX616_002152 [Lobosporangium transversale]
MVLDINTSSIQLTQSISRYHVEKQITSEEKLWRRKVDIKGRRGPNWTPEEDQVICKAIQDGKSCFEIIDHFPGRTTDSVNHRLCSIRNEQLRSLAFNVPARPTGILTKYARRWDLESLKDIATSLKESDEASNIPEDLMTLKLQVKEKIGPIRKPHLQVINAKQPWTEENDQLLECLVKKCQNEPYLWCRVSGGVITDEDGNVSVLNRASTSCCRRWAQLNRPISWSPGAWHGDEDRRLIQALKQQIGNNFQMIVNVRGTDAPSRSKDGKYPPAAAASSEDKDKPLLQPESKELKSVDWIELAEYVGARDEIQCRAHFHSIYHNGNYGCFSQDEMKRALEAYEQFGPQWLTIAARVGTRAPAQVLRTVRYILRKKKSSSSV